MNKRGLVDSILFLLMFIMLLELVPIKSASAQPSTKNQKNTSAGKLSITSPKEGTIFSPGDTVIVKASYEGEQPERGVAFLSQDSSLGADISAPYEYQFQIKKEFIGLMLIVAWTMEKDGRSEQAGVEIRVKAKDKPKFIRVIPDLDIYMKPGEDVILYVEGVYPDGITRDITSPDDAGTTYSSDDSSIATVSKEGVIKGVAVGKTFITIKNGVTFGLRVRVVDRF